jgi:hypothetical protein
MPDLDRHPVYSWSQVAAILSARWTGDIGPLFDLQLPDTERLRPVARRALTPYLSENEWEPEMVARVSIFRALRAAAGRDVYRALSRAESVFAMPKSEVDLWLDWMALLSAGLRASDKSARAFREPVEILRSSGLYEAAQAEAIQDAWTDRLTSYDDLPIDPEVAHFVLANVRQGAVLLPALLKTLGSSGLIEWLDRGPSQSLGLPVPTRLPSVATLSSWLKLGGRRRN